MSAHTSQTELKLIGKLILEGEMQCETGLHVGAGKGSLEIGGSDNPVVKDAFGRPYVPGSSLRGKIRSLLEQSSGVAVPSELVYLSRRKGQEVRIHQSDRPDDEICLLFGRNPGRIERVQGETLDTTQATPARLAVFDAPLDPESITAQMRENLDDELTEVKSENAIDRITSQANPRTLERVPAGARFKTRFVMDVLCEEDAPLFMRVLEGLRLLEDDALGGGGSRGSGRVSFSKLRLVWRGRNYYASGAAEKEIGAGATLAAVQTAVSESAFSFLKEAIMNPGLVVKLRPTGPWRIGPDSGARNRVDSIYHSDSLYSAVTSAMARLGSLEDWLNATARHETPAVCFSSCFPFLDEIGFVIPPRTIWPPASAALLSARVRWKSARFVPLAIVQAILAGQTLDDNHWTIDGPSECLVPTGRPGPFRTAVRWSAAIDRLTGAAERHSTACIEFRPGSGLWTIVSFVDEVAHAKWSDLVKAAFRLLADSGFGGERSRGWGRAESPEFVEGMLPEMVLGTGDSGARGWGLGAGESSPDVLPVPPIEEPPPAEPPVTEPERPGEPEPPEPEPPAYPEPDPLPAFTAADTPTPSPQPPTPDKGHWLLSLFTPAAADTVDWRRGNYTVLARGGRVDSPAGSGEVKKQVQMVTEGSVLYAASAPCGSASDVAPDGFAHPVFRAGFALSIPLPEVS